MMKLLKKHASRFRHGKLFNSSRKGVNAMDNVQFDEAYERLVDTAAGECAVYEFRNKLGAVRSVFLKREIPDKIDNQTYYELVTPFTYGGPVILSCQEGRRWELAAAFTRAFRTYCLQYDIVSEKIRFHPVLGNADDFAGCYDMEKIGETAAIDLRVKNPVCDEFTARCKKRLFKALENGVDSRVTVGPGNAAHFAELYRSIAAHQTSPKDGLNKHQLTKCIEKLGGDLVVTEALYKERTIAVSLSRLSGGVLQPELSSVLPGFAHLSPEAVLQYGLTCWGKKRGADFIHLGESAFTDNEGEGVAFNAHSNRNARFDFWTGRKIWNREVYNKLCVAARHMPELDDASSLKWEAEQNDVSFY